MNFLGILLKLFHLIIAVTYFTGGYTDILPCSSEDKESGNKINNREPNISEGKTIRKISYSKIAKKLPQ